MNTSNDVLSLDDSLLASTVAVDVAINRSRSVEVIVILDGVAGRSVVLLGLVLISTVTNTDL